jgi:glutathione S-transferase
MATLARVVRVHPSGRFDPQSLIQPLFQRPHPIGDPVKLIGMLDSPYVRRVAISLQLLGLKFEHQSLSVFRTFDEFRKINPVVKAPTLVCDDGQTLMDSTLILAYAEALAAPRTLMPKPVQDLQQDLHLIGLALAATEKSVQAVYEHQVRPAEKLHTPWLERVTQQKLTAYDELERALAHRALPLDSASMSQAGVTVAVAWHFTQQTVPVLAERYPRLAAYSQAVEALPEFQAAPYGDSTYQG